MFFLLNIVPVCRVSEPGTGDIQRANTSCRPTICSHLVTNWNNGTIVAAMYRRNVRKTNYEPELSCLFVSVSDQSTEDK